MTEINGWISIPNAYANTLFARGGWNSITLDAQHGLFDERALLESLLALQAATPRRYVRVAANEPAQICKVLDAGADGVIAPMINTADDARQLADACWYPPRGTRSYAPHLAMLRAGTDGYERFTDTIEVQAMIETREALGNVKEIAATPGIKGLFIGPNDLAISHGLKPGSDREEPDMLAAISTILNAAHEAGKRAAIFCATTSYASRMAKLGFDMVVAGIDTALLSNGATAATHAMLTENTAT